MHQCKIFTHCLPNVLEDQVNQWFLDNSGIWIFDVIYKNDPIHSVFILYESSKEVK